MKKRDWVKEYFKSRERMAQVSANLKKVIERKKKRKPSQWTFEELSNPDHEWLEFLRDIRMVLGREPNPRERKNVGMYLRLNTKHFKNRPEPLRRHERKKLREMVRDHMQQNEAVPDLWTLRRFYKSVKGKKRKELWK